MPPDPLRTRMRFLGALPRAQQARFLADAERQVQLHLQMAAKDCQRQRDDPYTYRMACGAVAMLRARLEWVREIAADLGSA